MEAAFQQSQPLDLQCEREFSFRLTFNVRVCEAKIKYKIQNSFIKLSVLKILECYKFSNTSQYNNNKNSKICTINVL